jgi:valyl-tRNA synthetase
VFFTSIIRDKQGRKMSKMLGNSPDPMDLMAKYGADGLRFGLLRIAPAGTDVKFDEAQIEEGRNFANKLWNAARFRQMQADGAPVTIGKWNNAGLSVFCVDIFAKLDQVQSDYDAALAEYSFNTAAQLLYDFFWGNYCDLFLEATKTDFTGGTDPAVKAATLSVIDTVFGRYLQLLHPYMPHVTEELWSTMGYPKDGVFLMQTPLATEPLLQRIPASLVSQAQATAAAVYETAGRIRNLKATCDLASKRDLSFVLKPSGDSPDSLIPALKFLGGAGDIRVDATYAKGKNTPATLTPLGEVSLPLDGVTDVNAVRTRLARERDKAQVEIGKVDAKLSSESFMSRAPEDIVQEHRQRRIDFVAQVGQLEEMLRNLE